MRSASAASHCARAVVLPDPAGASTSVSVHPSPDRKIESGRLRGTRTGRSTGGHSFVTTSSISGVTALMGQAEPIHADPTAIGGGALRVDARRAYDLHPDPGQAGQHPHELRLIDH